MRVLAPRHRERLYELHGIYLDAAAVESLEVLIDDEDAADWMGTLWRVAPHCARERAIAAYPDAIGGPVVLRRAAGGARLAPPSDPRSGRDIGGGPRR